MASAENELLTDLLKAVSRSFYLTLRVLPQEIRSQISLAYLLARTTDTIADTEIVPIEKRLRMLQALRERILGTDASPLNFQDLAQHQGSAAERVLLERCEDALELLQRQSPGDRQLIRDVLDVITGGQELDLRRFGNPAAGKLVALGNDAELDDYTYRVAGCVGQFWTRICLAHQFSTPETMNPAFEELGIRFGKGLQLVNILRDIPADLGKGRCYIPTDRLKGIGLAPEDLLCPTTEPKFRPLYNEYLDVAQAHLNAGWEYTNLIPFRQVRVRLACAWPILFGLKTLNQLRAGNVLDPQKRIKITRGDVGKIMMRTVLCYPLPGVWRGMPRSKPIAIASLLS